MKIKQLIEILSELDGNLEVILSSDPEGNNFSPLGNVDSNMIYHGGDIHDPVWTASEAGFDKQIWEKMKANPNCIVLVPLN